MEENRLNQIPYVPILSKPRAKFIFIGRDPSPRTAKIVGKRGGKYHDTLGALLVRTADGIVHKVSGMTDEERDLWWNDPEAIVDSVVECQAMQKLPDGTYREPRYKAVRHDKTSKDID